MPDTNVATPTPTTPASVTVPAPVAAPIQSTVQPPAPAKPAEPVATVPPKLPPAAQTPPAPVVPAKPVVIPPVVTKTTAAPIQPPSRAAAAITELLGAYKTFLTGTNGTPAAFRNAALTLGNIVARLLQTPTDEVLTVVWDFFVANKNGVLIESAALQGIDALDLQSRQKTEFVYILFRQAVSGIDVGDVKRVRSDLVQAKLNSPKLILFLQEKARLVAIQATRSP